MNVSEKAAEIAKMRADALDRMIFNYLEKHPELTIDDIEMVERKLDGGAIAWYIRKKGSTE